MISVVTHLPFESKKQTAHFGGQFLYGVKIISGVGIRLVSKLTGKMYEESGVFSYLTSCIVRTKPFHNKNKRSNP